MKAIIKEIELDCECMNCGSNSMPVLNDIDNQDFEETLEEEINEGWIFKQSAKFKSVAPAVNHTMYSSDFTLYAFCGEDCFQEWLKEEGESADLYMPADLRKFQVEIDDELEVLR